MKQGMKQTDETIHIVFSANIGLFYPLTDLNPRLGVIWNCLQTPSLQTMKQLMKQPDIV